MLANIYTIECVILTCVKANQRNFCTWYDVGQSYLVRTNLHVLYIDKFSCKNFQNKESICQQLPPEHPYWFLAKKNGGDSLSIPCQ